MWTWPMVTCWMIILFMVWGTKSEEQGNGSVFFDADGRDRGYARDQRRLIRYLTNVKEHESRARPVEFAREPINVTIRTNLYQIIDVDERNQFVILYAWMTQMWKDFTLAWDPLEYSNISMVVLPFTQIWLPDTYLYNNVEMVRDESERWINVIVEMFPDDPDAAAVTFRYPALYKFTCSLDVKYFPFDKQICIMVFGSWTYDATGIDFFPEKELVAREDFSASEEWELINFTATKTLEKYACCPEPFSLLRQRLVMRRKPLHYLVNLIIPTVIISVISTVGFFTPSTTTGERTEKVELGIATLLAFAILLLMVADQMPTTSRSVPLIGWFLLGIMVQTAVGTLGSTLILIIHNVGQNGKRVSPRVRRIFFHFLARLFHVTIPIELKSKSMLEPPVSMYTMCQSNISSDPDPSAMLSLDDVAPIHRYRQFQRHRRMSRLSVASFSSPRCALDMIGVCPVINESEIAYAEYEWLAEILDRITLAVVLMGVIGVTVTTLAIGYAQ